MQIFETHKALAERHKFSLANAESRRKRTRDNAQKAKQRKGEAQKKQNARSPQPAVLPRRSYDRSC